MQESKRRLKYLRVQIPRDLWDDLELLTYILRLEGSPKTKGDIVAEALRKYLNDNPELRKEIERARHVLHVEDEEA